MKRRTAGWSIAIVVVVGVVLALVGRSPGVESAMLGFVERVRGAGPAGPILYAVAYLVAMLSMLPAWPLSAGAGFAFGALKGFLLVHPVSIAGSALTFLLGRTVMRGWAERKICARPAFRALDRAIGDNGFKLVVLMRLALVFPFNFLNYGFGATRMRFRDWVLGTAVGTIPGTALYVYVGSLATSAGDLGRAGGRARWIASVVGLVLGAIVIFLLVRYARRALAAEQGVGDAVADAGAAAAEITGSASAAPPESRRDARGPRRPRVGAAPPRARARSSRVQPS